MSVFLSIDGGTTNTRITLVRDGEAVDTLKISFGAQAARSDPNAQKGAIRDGILTVLARNALCESGVERVLASGMITSEFGLCNLPHAIAPAGLADLHAATEERTLPEVTSIPFVFMRGVKCAGAGFDEIDMMRGEETELMGLIDPALGPCAYVLPGSHSKVIEVDGQGRILRFSTLLSGEMFAALSGHTILGDAVDMAADGVDNDYLMMGYAYAKEQGVNKAIFKTRVLKNHLAATPVQCTSYFRGVILCDEIREILRCGADTVVLGGKRQMREAIAEILTRLGGKRVICLDEQTVERSVTRGQLRVYYGE